MTTDGHIELPTKGFSEVDNPGLGSWLLIVDTENANTITLVLGTAVDPPQAIPLVLADQVETFPPFAAQQDDFGPAGWTNASVARLAATGAQDVTGFDAAGLPGTALRKKLINVGASDITLKHQDGSSAAANRILIPGGADLIMQANDAVDIFYDLADTRWRVV